jgi:hypothetical protein
VLIVVLVLVVPVAICGLLVVVALLLPAVQYAREAARIAKSSQNLRQIGVALHTYHDVWNTLPPAFLPDENGKPRSSWRTSLLPQLEQGDLMKQYDFSVAWDDPRNASVVGTPLAVYQSPRDPARLRNRTSYVVVRGPDTVFPGAMPLPISSMMEGTANTVLVLEIRNSDIQWAEPRDLDIDSISTDPSAPNSVNLAAGALVCFGDGSARMLPRGTTLETLKELLNRR